MTFLQNSKTNSKTNSETNSETNSGTNSKTSSVPGGDLFPESCHLIRDVPLIMTPGPTQIRENVRAARSLITTNPDLDDAFFDFYRETCDRIAFLMNTKSKVLILSGEGMIGLEAGCVSLIEPGDHVLVLDNGIFGTWFCDMAEIFGGIPTIYQDDRERGIDPEKFRLFLEKADADLRRETGRTFKCATVVHCDTPTGVLNDISAICRILKDHGILTIVDAVSSFGGVPVSDPDGKIDILIGASQKALSAPPGLTIVAVSDDAFTAMENRKTRIASYYADLLSWKNYYEKKWFPHTPPASDINGLRVAVENIISENEEGGAGPSEIPACCRRHERIASAFRKAVCDAGLELFLKSNWSNTVTVIRIPENIPSLTSEKLLSMMREKYNIMIAGCFGDLEGKVIRVGHMGENADERDVSLTLKALAGCLKELGFDLKADPAEVFEEELRKNP